LRILILAFVRLKENTPELVIGKFDPQDLAVIGAEYELDVVEASIAFEPHLVRGEE
jgi:hypothetical protein